MTAEELIDHLRAIHGHRISKLLAQEFDDTATLVQLKGEIRGLETAIAELDAYDGGPIPSDLPDATLSAYLDLSAARMDAWEAVTREQSVRTNPAGGAFQ